MVWLGVIGSFASACSLVHLNSSEILVDQYIDRLGGRIRMCSPALALVGTHSVEISPWGGRRRHETLSDDCGPNRPSGQRPPRGFRPGAAPALLVARRSGRLHCTRQSPCRLGSWCLPACSLQCRGCGGCLPGHVPLARQEGRHGKLAAVHCQLALLGGSQGIPERAYRFGSTIEARGPGGCSRNCSAARPDDRPRGVHNSGRGTGPSASDVSRAACALLPARAHT